MRVLNSSVEVTTKYLAQIVTVHVLPSARANVVVKAKAIPLQAWTGPEGSRGLRLPDFKTIGTLTL